MSARVPSAWIWAATLSAGLTLAALVALKGPLLGLLGFVAVIVAVIAVLRPLAALMLLIGVTVSNAGAVLESSFGVPLYTPVLGLALLSVLLGVRRGELRLVWSHVFTVALVYLAMRSLSVLGATDRENALVTLSDEAKSLASVCVLVPMLGNPRALDAAAKLIVALMAGLAAFSLFQEFVLGNATILAGFSNVALGPDVGGVTARHSGPLEDPNFWARYLVLFLPLALSFVAARTVSWRRLCWAVAVVALGSGLYLTQSRGGLLAAFIAVMVFLLLLGRRHARLLLFAPLLIALLLVVPGLGSRLATLTDAGAAEEGLAGRAFALETGLEMFADRPALGVGVGNFEVAQPEYARRIGANSAMPVAPHNLFLQMAAEGGLPGIAAWLLFYGGIVFAGFRSLILSSRMSSGVHPSSAQLMSAGIVAGLAGWAFASLFLHLAGFPVLLIVAAMAASLDVQARAEAGLPVTAMGTRGPQSHSRQLGSAP